MRLDAAIIDTVRRHAVEVTVDLAAAQLLEAIGPDVSVVLIGEATVPGVNWPRFTA